MNVLRTLSATGWLIFAVLALSLVLLGWCALDARQDAARAVRKAEAGQTLADARTAAAQDASTIRDRADARNTEITTTTQEATDEIRQATDDDTAAAAALRGLCRLHPDRDPRCRMQQPLADRVD